MPNNSNETEIRELIENWAKAVREGNMAGVLAHHTNDITIFDISPPLRIKGIDAYRKTWEPFLSYANGGFDLSELKITASDNVAFCHALLRVGDEKKPQVRLTMGFHKVRGKWLATHEHHSAPIDE
jgi:ketosteroid isomerase-like protein